MKPEIIPQNRTFAQDKNARFHTQNKDNVWPFTDNEIFLWGGFLQNKFHWFISPSIGGPYLDSA